MLTDIQSQAPAEMPGWAIALIPLAFFLFFPLLWCFVMWINSRLSGWSRLVKDYRAEDPPDGRLWAGVQARVGVVSYKNTLDCTTSLEGIHIRPSPLFRFAHPPLMIPWSELHHVQRTQLIWLPMVRAEIGHPRKAGFVVSARVFEQSEGKVLLEDTSG